MHATTLPPQSAALRLHTGVACLLDKMQPLFVFNIVAVISYPDLSDAGLKEHVLWGALLLVTLVYGPSKLALDRWLERRQPA